MRILVLGSGVIGMTSAWYLAKAGHEVTVVDRQPGPALETSYANAGMLSTGYSSPWAAPGVPRKAIGWLLAKHAPLAIRLTSDPAQYRWMLQLLRNCSQSRYTVNKARMLRLASHSRDCLAALRQATGIDYEGRQGGTLQVFRSQQQLDAAAKDMAVLAACDIHYELLDPAGCKAVEPGLDSPRILGGLRLPGDETGDCQLFTEHLTAACRELGVRLLFNTPIRALDVQAGAVKGVHTQAGYLEADRYVLALGSYSPALLQPHGVRLPVYPVKGYSLTLPVADEAAAPQSTLMDETYKVAVTRFAQRIRVGGMAELTGFDARLPPARKATLIMVLDQLFPGAGNTQNAEFWCGFRPMTPDGTPIIGPSPLENLWLNTGHGTLGWTMACGSAQLLSDLISNRKPALNPVDYALTRPTEAAPSKSWQPVRSH
ncbi:MAG: D-amino acid dehydrogenase [Pseudomonadaceae bacterium]|nr:MAG: D-amino acid dehydrogenase [Pseudomonadaceae bacterium]